MIALNYWQMAAAVAASTAFGFVFALVVLYHPGRPEPARARPTAPPAPLPRDGYLPTDNAGCYEPRTDWPEPDWPDSTFSEISAGWDRLERNVTAQTSPMRKISGKYLQ